MGEGIVFSLDKSGPENRSQVYENLVECSLALGVRCGAWMVGSAKYKVIEKSEI
jgi:hypothetical protein